MALTLGKLRCQTGKKVQAGSPTPLVRPSGRAPCCGARLGFQSSIKPAQHRVSRQLRTSVKAAAAAESGVIKLELPADEALQTLKIVQRGDGKFIVEDVIAESTAAQYSVEKGSVLKAVSDPAAPNSMWQLEPRSSLRHVLDQFRLQQTSVVKMEILPPEAAEEEADGRTGFDKGQAAATGKQQVQWNQRIDERTMQRRQEQREQYLATPGTTNTTNWLLLAFAVVLLPAAGILFLAIQSGFLDEMNAGWRAGL